jgi:hypothetical protein
MQYLMNRRRRLLSGSFSPASLFAAGEPGVWFDPSPTTTFTDTAGTTPATVGSAVALMLDKSLGATGKLGPELVTNGAFTAGTDWTLGTGWAIGSGVATKTAGTAAVLSQAVSLTAGRAYELTYTMTRTAGTLTPRITGGTTVNFTARTAGGTYTQIVSAVTGNTTLEFSADASFAGTVDDVTLKILTGFHATQPTLASRPILGRVPANGRRNILVGTATLATQTCVVTAAQHTLSFRGTGTVTLTGASTSGPLVGTGANDIVSLTFTPTAGNLTLTVSGTVNDAQLELGAARTTYQLVGSSTFDVTEAGQADSYYLFHGGSADPRWMVTPTITPGTDKVQVFAGVRKLSDAARGWVIETSTDANQNNGSVWLTTPRNIGVADAQFSSRGTIPITASSSVDAAPNSMVMAGIGDIAGDNAALRINGTQVAQDTGDQGTGNYLAYPLYIGSRAGTSLYFNGQLFQLIARFGPNLDANTITQTEKFVASKTAGVSIP